MARGIGLDVIAAQLVRQPIRADLRAGEDQHLLEPAGLDLTARDQRAQRRAAAALGLSPIHT